ncbi:NPC intracellular cholesterol transporter 2 homolog a-like [Topomyia yanbarensis]|uniref:NPC intracellular cholesterol transporter 2 homolog a-like n=1 Tax=Topomyia yanbarensis TaxID=2498891 RepID=UPI00273AFA35|nr:NPC intracellular cholesterol transporter 2 homolog a-like [Topomyia yanbarensis]
MMCKSLAVSAVVLVLVSILTDSFVQGVEFENCADANTIGNYSLIEVSNCNVDQPACVLKRNTNATISITFESDEDLTQLKAVVHGVILGMEVPFKLPNDDGCVDSGLECPLSKDTEYKYTATLPVLKQYPKVSVDVKWELKDGDRDVVCVKIPAKIQ